MAMLRLQRWAALFRDPVPPVVVGLAGLLTAMTLSGCAGQGTTRTGFITDYAGMKPTPGHVDDLIYVKPGFSIADYQRAIIEPVVWHPASHAPSLRDTVATRMDAAFGEELVRQIGSVMTVARSSDCAACMRTLRIQAAITNIRRSKWYYNMVPMALGLGAAAAGGALPPIPPPAPGGASEEMEVTDNRTGELLVAISTYNNGMPWNTVGQITPYGHARRAFRLAARLLASELASSAAPTGTAVARR